MPTDASSGDLAGFVGNDRLLQLGRVSVNFQYCETICGFLVWSLLPTDQTAGAAVTSQLPFERLLTVLQVLARLRLQQSEELVTGIERLVALLSDLAQERNTLVHSTWGANDNGTVTRLKFTASRKKGVQVQDPIVDATEIKRVADDLGQCGRDLMALALKARTAGLIDFATTDTLPGAAP